MEDQGRAPSVIKGIVALFGKALGLGPLLKSADPEELLQYLQREYAALKRLQTTQSDAEFAQNYKDALFVIAMGLLAFGKLDAVDDAISSVTRHGKYMDRLANLLPVLLPYPRELDVERDNDAIQEWFRQNYPSVRWNETLERFE